VGEVTLLHAPNLFRPMRTIKIIDLPLINGRWPSGATYNTMSKKRTEVPNTSLTQPKVLELGCEYRLDVPRLDCEVDNGAHRSMRGSRDILVILGTVLQILRDAEFFISLNEFPYVQDPESIIFSYPVGWLTSKSASGSSMAA